jgi:hypothetical protein
VWRGRVVRVPILRDINIYNNLVMMNESTSLLHTQHSPPTTIPQTTATLHAIQTAATLPHPHDFEHASRRVRIDAVFLSNMVRLLRLMSCTSSSSRSDYQVPTTLHQHVSALGPDSVQRLAHVERMMAVQAGPVRSCRTIMTSSRLLVSSFHTYIYTTRCIHDLYILIHS